MKLASKNEASNFSPKEALLNLIFGLYRIFLLLVLSTTLLHAQDVNEQLVFTLSNDKFADDDKYFTNGLYFNYKRILPKSFFLEKTNDNKLQLNIGIGNEIYSPTSISSVSSADFDRPFAGWLFARLAVGSIQQKKAFFVITETGITGKESLAGTLQVALHDFFNIDSRPTWKDEISFKWLVNFKTNHVFDVGSNSNNAFQYRISPSFGTKDIFLENEVSYFFGRLNSFQNSSRTAIVGKGALKEFYGYVSAGYKYVVHNTLIQGGIFADNDAFTTDITNHILKAAVGAVLQSKRNLFKVSYHFNTKETPLSTSHIYGSLSYSRSF